MDTKGFKKHYTICITSLILPNPAAQASWDRQRKEKISTGLFPCLLILFLARFLIFKVLAGKAAWSLICVWVRFRWKTYTNQRHRNQDSHPLFLMTEGTHCQAPLPSPESQLLPGSPALDNAVTQFPSQAGKTSFFFCIDPQTPLFLYSYCLLSPPEKFSVPFDLFSQLFPVPYNYSSFPSSSDHAVLPFAFLLPCSFLFSLF